MNRVWCERTLKHVFGAGAKGVDFHRNVPWIWNLQGGWCETEMTGRNRCSCLVVVSRYCLFTIMVQYPLLLWYLFNFDNLEVKCYIRLFLLASSNPPTVHVFPFVCVSVCISICILWACVHDRVMSILDCDRTFRCQGTSHIDVFFLDRSGPAHRGRLTVWSRASMPTCRSAQSACVNPYMAFHPSPLAFFRLQTPNDVVRRHQAVGNLLCPIHTLYIKGSIWVNAIVKLFCLAFFNLWWQYRDGQERQGKRAGEWHAAKSLEVGLGLLICTSAVWANPQWPILVFLHCPFLKLWVEYF